MNDGNPAEPDPAGAEGTYAIQVKGKLIIGILLLLVGLGVFAGLYWPLRQQNRYELLFLAVIFFFSGYTYLKQWHINRGAQIKVSHEGLVFVDKGGRTTPLPWTTIKEIRQKVLKYHLWLFMVPTKNFEYQIITTTGYALNIDTKVEDHEQLMQAIQIHANPHIKARLRSDYDRGEEIEFAKLRISKSGLKKDSETVPWSEIRSVEVKEGNVHVTRKGRSMSWEVISVLDIADYWLLIPIVNEILREHRPEE